MAIPFLELANPIEKHTLLGLQLKPLTIGHCLLLEQFECLPVKDDSDLITAVLICSRDHDEFMPLLEDPWLKWKLRIWHWRLGKIDWVEKILAFGDYFDSQSKPPLTVSLQDSQSSGESGCPFMLHLKTYLTARCGYTQAEVLKTPVGLALWDYYAHAELEGNVKIVDREAAEKAVTDLDENIDELFAEARRIQQEEKRRTVE